MSSKPVYRSALSSIVTGSVDARLAVTVVVDDVELVGGFLNEVRGGAMAEGSFNVKIIDPSKRRTLMQWVAITSAQGAGVPAHNSLYFCNG